MPITFKGMLEDCEGYEGKNGFGANITVSAKNSDNKVKRLEFRTNSKEMAQKLEKLLGKQITVTCILQQNNFGLRLGDLLEVA